MHRKNFITGVAVKTELLSEFLLNKDTVHGMLRRSSLETKENKSYL